MGNEIFEVARQKITSFLIHTFFNSTGSYSKDGEYYLLSPLRPDKSVGSFHINELTGTYYDHATGEGGDFIDLVSKSRNISLKEAAEAIITESGSIFIKPDNKKQNKNKKTKKDLIKPILPIPDTNELKKSIKERVKQEWYIDSFGKPKNITRYFNEKGEWQFCVCRFIKEGKTVNTKRQKNDILFYYGEDHKWWTGHHPDLKPFPPLGIQNLKDNKKPILIVEGEKCGRVEVKGYNVISWIGGTAGIKNTDWQKLKKLTRDRDIIIWPDADSQLDRNKEYYLPFELQPGYKTAHYLKSILPTAKILDIYRAKPIETDPHGWDIADFTEEGGDPVKFIKEYMPYKSLDVEVYSYHVYRKFIDDFYYYDSLDQIEGWYWQYEKEKHFWKKANKPDINCNLQRWLEDTGLQWVISEKVKATGFINEVKQYIDRHSLGYISDNPFKNSSISPYVHFQNGAVLMMKDSIEWISRHKYGEDYFKKLYPTYCLDFDFDYKSYKTIDIKESCPAFFYFIKGLIPEEYLLKLDDEDEYNEVLTETINYISQIIAYTLSAEKPNEYIFGIFGAQRTGKSFFIEIIKSIIGDEFCIETPISNMENNRFAAAQLWDKKVYIEPDLKTRHQLPEDFIKAYSGRQSITIEAKNKDPVSGVKISISMFFLSNYEFQVKGIEGVERRMMMLPYRNKIKKPDTRLLEKITGKYPHGKESGLKEGEVFDERPVIIALAFQGWDNFCNNNHEITVPHWITEIKEQWVIESSSVLSFLDEKYFSNSINKQISRSDLYSEYKEYCNDDNKKPYGKKNFYSEVRKDNRVEELKIGGVYNFIITSIKDTTEKEIPF